MSDGPSAPHAPPRALDVVTRLELLKVAWTVIGRSRRPITCAIYCVATGGLELRAGYDVSDTVWAESVLDIPSGLVVAERWRQVMLARGFNEIPTTTLIVQ
jgi:hypothetical protein